MGFAAGGRVTADELNLAGCVARGRRTTTSAVSTSTSDVAVLRVSGIPFKAGRLYYVLCKVAFDSSVTGDEMRARIRYTTDGSDATTSSSILEGSLVNDRQTDANVADHKAIFVPYVSATDHTGSLLLCHSRIAGTGNCSLFVDSANGDAIHLLVIDADDDPGDTGVSLP